MCGLLSVYNSSPYGRSLLFYWIRQAIDDKLNLERIVDEFKQKNPSLDINKNESPEYIPKGKYLGISRNSIVVVGNTLEEVIEKLHEKFPDSAAGVIRKGQKIEKFEVIFLFFPLKKLNVSTKLK
jgi:Lhr-like helicase